MEKIFRRIVGLKEIYKAFGCCEIAESSKCQNPHAQNRRMRHPLSSSYGPDYAPAARDDSRFSPSCWGVTRHPSSG